jgi:hypothetical protein
MHMVLDVTIIEANFGVLNRWVDGRALAPTDQTF